ncbi:hypothetical protein SORBI_3001G304600 [Sorghum bicolor]|uniref:Uncharacterized protein n=2 Tax=Sorghum bicolor TaxID=4558 RepID=A0A1Z5S8B6_SORBI|nr:hypothetical protein SORBI_3001G304600 [Sorghum bicolor]
MTVLQVYLPVCSCLAGGVRGPRARWRCRPPRQRGTMLWAVACAVVSGMAVWPGTGRGHGRDGGGWRFCWSWRRAADEMMASPSRVSRLLVLLVQHRPARQAPAIRPFCEASPLLHSQGKATPNTTPPWATLPAAQSAHDVPVPLITSQVQSLSSVGPVQSSQVVCPPGSWRRASCP